MSRKTATMKRVLTMLAALLLVTVIPLFSCAEDKTPASGAQETRQKEQYEKSMEERLRVLGKQLDELTAKASDMTDETRKEIKSYLTDAEKKRKAAIRKLEEMRKNSEQKWEKFSSQLNDAADDFAKAYDKAKSRFQE